MLTMERVKTHIKTAASISQNQTRLSFAKNPKKRIRAPTENNDGKYGEEGAAKTRRY